MYHHFVSLFHTQYDHVDQFCQGYNHDINNQYKLVVSGNPDVLDFYLI